MFHFTVNCCGIRRNRPTRCRSRRAKYERKLMKKMCDLMDKMYEASGVESLGGQIYYGEEGAKAILEAAEKLRKRTIESN
jgi:hypothetical protein